MRLNRFVILLTGLILPVTLLNCIPPVNEAPPLPHENVTIPQAGAGDIYDLSYLKDRDPAQVDNTNLPVSPVERLSLTGRPPKEVDISKFRLTVSGMVKNTLDLSYDEMQAFPPLTRVVLLICHGSHVDNARWTGVPVSFLLDKAEVLVGASEVTFIAMDRYSRTLPMETARRDGSFVAHTVNGVPIPLKHGYPLRLVVQGIYGENWVKWLRQIDVK